MKMVALGELVDINPKPGRTLAGEPVSFVGMAELDGLAAVARPRESRMFEDVSKGYTQFRDGDILIAKITPCFENGKIGVAELGHEVGVGSTEFHVARARDGVDVRYLLHFLRQPWIKVAGELRMTGSGGQRRVPVQFLESLEVPLPSLDEQRRIAAILDRAEVIRRDHQSVLGHLSHLSEAVFLESFGRAEASTTVAEASSLIRTGPFGSQLLHEEFVEQGIAVLGLDNVVGNEFRWSARRYITQAKYEQLRRYTVAPGDVLISIMGTVGRCVVVPEGIPTAINTKHICAITVDGTRIGPEFLRACFLWHPEVRRYLRSHTKGAIMDGLNMGIIKSIPLPLPEMAWQQSFVHKLAAIEARVAAVRQSADAAVGLWASLQSCAFRGEL